MCVLVQYSLENDLGGVVKGNTEICEYFGSKLGTNSVSYIPTCLNGLQIHRVSDW